MRTVIPAMLAAILTAFPAIGRAQGAADWKAEEQRCIDLCPEFPRFSGTESDQQYKKRIQQEDAYNACHSECVRQYLRKLGVPSPPHDDGAPGYYERNAGNGPEYPSAP